MYGKDFLKYFNTASAKDSAATWSWLANNSPGSRFTTCAWANFSPPAPSNCASGPNVVWVLVQQIGLNVIYP